MRPELYEPNLRRDQRIDNLKYTLSLRPLVEDATALKAFRKSSCCRFALNGIINGASCEQCVVKRLQLGEVAQMQREPQSWDQMSSELVRLLAQPDVEVPPGPPIRVCEPCSMEVHDEPPCKRARHSVA